MPLFMYQAAYSSDSWAAQVKNPQNRVETVGRQLCEAAGGKFVGGWLCFDEYDLVLIADVPNNESMAAIAMAVAAGGKARASKIYRTKDAAVRGARESSKGHDVIVHRKDGSIEKWQKPG